MAASFEHMPVSAATIDPRCFDWDLKYEVYLAGVKTSFVLAIVQNFVSLLNLLDITLAWKESQYIFNLSKCVYFLYKILYYRIIFCSSIYIRNTINNTFFKKFKFFAR